MRGFAVSGPLGSFIQLEKGGFVYTFDGVDDPTDPEGVLEMEKRAGDSIAWQHEPLAGDLSREEIEENCGITPAK